MRFRRIRLFSLLLLMAIALAAQVSVPVTPSQPDKPSYAVSELWLVKTFDRASYKAAFGLAAPVCDPKKKVKAWFDSSMAAEDPESLAVYKGLLTDKAGAPAIKQFWMTAGEAATVNLQGRESYPEWHPAPTEAYIPPSTPAQGNTILYPGSLITLEQAQMLAKELGGTVQGPGGWPQAVYPPDEKRRVYTIIVDGKAHDGGALLIERYSSGIAAPGHWVKADQSESLEFVYDAPPDCAGLQSWTVPVRDLVANEVIKDLPFGGPTVVRTDKAQQAAEAGGQFTPADRAVLQSIAKKLGVQ
jgi:hypothetical protein